MNDEKTPKKRPARRSKGTKSVPDQRELGFEAALAELEKVVQQLEQGDLGLSESLSCYEQGVHYLQRCYRELESAERRVELLKDVGAGGQAVTEPFDEEAMSLEEKAIARGARRGAKSRRTKPPNSPPDVDDSPELF